VIVTFSAWGQPAQSLRKLMSSIRRADEIEGGGFACRMEAIGRTSKITRFIEIRREGFGLERATRPPAVLILSEATVSARDITRRPESCEACVTRETL
jgi:hypothetical protein